MSGSWARGELIVRREVLGLQPSEVKAASPVSGVWEGLPVYVIEDSPEQLVSYTASGAELGFVAGDWPTPDGLHPGMGVRVGRVMVASWFRGPRTISPSGISG